MIPISLAGLQLFDVSLPLSLGDICSPSYSLPHKFLVMHCSNKNLVQQKYLWWVDGLLNNVTRSVHGSNSVENHIICYSGANRQVTQRRVVIMKNGMETICSLNWINVSLSAKFAEYNDIYTTYTSVTTIETLWP